MMITILNDIKLLMKSKKNISNYTYKRCFFGAASSLWGQVGTLKQHQEERVVPYSADLLYKVVADVEKYKEFVPYTVESKIIKEFTPYECVCMLSVGFGMISESYNSRVICNPEKKYVTASAEDSYLFKTLNTKWILKDRPLDPQSCLLQYSVEFQFHSALHNSMAEMFFDKVSNTMVDAFLGRCNVMKRGISSPVVNKNPGPVALYRRLQTLHQSPQAVLGELETTSHFTLAELERIQERFDNAAHNRVLNLQQFKELFLALFADRGHAIADLEECAQTIFTVLDLNKDNSLCLREFTAGLSTILKGTTEERCRFWCRCYDRGVDGRISRQELHDMVLTSMSVRTALLRAGAAGAPGTNDGVHHTVIVPANIDETAKQVVKSCFEKYADPATDTISVKDLLKSHIL